VEIQASSCQKKTVMPNTGCQLCPILRIGYFYFIYSGDRIEKNEVAEAFVEKLEVKRLFERRSQRCEGNIKKDV
jgi:hypothetical protein